MHAAYVYMYTHIYTYVQYLEHTELQHSPISQEWTNNHGQLEL